ncbi:hypothetical protein GF362_06650 [Candidatus Dojkabacteria bacterium]|nr:hypothetical protein [Candidatus Dojkabacteria bacterium]
MTENLPIQCLHPDLECPFRTEMDNGYCLISAANRGDSKHGKTPRARELWYTIGYGAPCTLLPPQCKLSTRLTLD